MHGFPHKFPTVPENATKPMVWGKSGKSIIITWEMHVFSHQFPITWEKTAKPIKWGKSGKLFPEISYKTHCMWRTWEIGTHTFPIVWVLFYH